MMRIGYLLGTGSIQGGGTGPYAWRVLELLLSQASVLNISFVIVCTHESRQDCMTLINRYNAKAELYLISPLWSLSTNLSKFGECLVECFSKSLTKLGISIRGIEYLYYLFSLPLRNLLSGLRLDLLYVPYQTSPFYKVSIPIVVTLHDVQELHYPEFFTPQERIGRAQSFWQAMKLSSAIVVSFAHVKQDIVKYFQVPESKIHICPLPYQTIQFQSPTYEEEMAYHHKYVQWEDFILYPAQTWQHKNHLSLIRTVKFVKEEYGRLLHVVCTGKRNSYYFKVIEEFLKKEKMDEQIHFVDIVPEKELFWLYKNCSLVVIPTLYEAGSFPLLEAMSLGTPVICSSVTSLPETIGDSQFIFEPLNIPQMANLIIRTFDDKEFRTANVLNSRNRIKQLMEINSSLFWIDMWKEITMKN